MMVQNYQRESADDKIFCGWQIFHCRCINPILMSFMQQQQHNNSSEQASYQLKNDVLFHWNSSHVPWQRQQYAAEAILEGKPLLTMILIQWLCCPSNQPFVTKEMQHQWFEWVAKRYKGTWYKVGKAVRVISDMICFNCVDSYYFTSDNIFCTQNIVSILIPKFNW